MRALVVMRGRIKTAAIFVLASLLSLFAASGVAFAALGKDWDTQLSAADNQWTSVAYANSVFVAVSQNGTNRVMTSPDAVTWTSRSAAAANSWQSVTYGNGLFVAVSSSGTGNRVMTSPDGITWTARTSAADNSWESVTYGNGLFVAVSSSGTGNRVMTSPDGITWTARTSAADNSWNSVTYGNGIYVAVAGGNADVNRVMTSTDGVTWTSRSAASDITWNAVTFGNGRFVAVGSNGTNANSVMTSADGVTWTSSTAYASLWSSVTFGNGMFVAVSLTQGRTSAMYSVDGVTWTAGLTSLAYGWGGVAAGPGYFAAVATTSGLQNGLSVSGVRVMRSALTEVATVWSSNSANNSALLWSDVNYGGGLFVAVAHNAGTSSVMTSPNGTAWTSQTSVDGLWNQVTYGAGRYVAVGDGGAAMYSDNATSWTSSSANLLAQSTCNFTGLAYGNGLYVASGDSCDVLATSADGITWTSRALPVTGKTWRAVAYGGGRWVAMSTTGDVATSTDGTTWSAAGVSGVAASDAVNAVTYGNSQFVAVGTSAHYTSPDGLTWTERIDTSYGRQFNDVTYGAGLFVAINQTLAGSYRVNTSPDGIRWTIRASSADNSWAGVAYGNGTFVAVAPDGTNNRVMYSNAAPTAYTSDVTSITDTTATLNALVNANGFDTSSITMKYSTDSSTVSGGGGTSATVSPTSATGTSDTAVSAAITGLSANTTYYYRVSATNSAGTSSGTVRSFVTGAAAPTGLTAIPGNAVAQVSFTAGASANTIVNYEYSTDAGSTWTALSPADAASPVLVPGLANAVASSVRLRAVTWTGGGASSSGVSVTPRVPPAAPAGVGVSAGTLSWNAESTVWVSGTDRVYVVYKRTADVANTAVKWAVFGYNANTSGGFASATSMALAAGGSATTCSAGNASAGWVGCNTPYGLVSGTSYTFRVFARATLAGTLGYMSATAVYTP